MKTFCITYEVLRSHMWHFLLGRFVRIILIRFSIQYDLINRSTIYTEYSTLCKFHEDLGSKQFSYSFSYNQYRLAWYSFLHLLDIDMESGFMCPLCKDSPSAVVMDATSLSFRKDFDSILEPSVQQGSRLKTGR